MSSLSNSKHDAIRIVVAEDDIDDREIFADVIHDIGNDIIATFVEDGEELIEHVKDVSGTHPELKPSIIILDVNMPHMDGKEALAKLKEMVSLDEIPVVTLTTSRNENLKQEMQKLGCRAFYSKPNSMKEYRSILIDILESCVPGRNVFEQRTIH